MPARLSIGEFARITHLSVKTLRHYHDAGLLEPTAIDPRSGYRYYAPEQVPNAQVIRRLRELGLPVREVRQVISTDDPAARGQLIADHLVRLENQLRQTQSAVTALRRLLRPTGGIEVELRRDSATTVAAVSATVDLADVEEWYSDAIGELTAALHQTRQQAAGPPGGVYDHELFTADRGNATVYLPVAGPPTIGRVSALVLPAVELAVTVHTGPHDDIDVTYGELGRYVTANALAVAGPMRERYLVGPRDDPDPSRWRTEIGWPVFGVGDDAASEPLPS